MTVNQQQLTERLGVTMTTLILWRRKGYFGDVPLEGHPRTFRYDLDAVKAAVIKHKLRVAVGAFDEPSTTT